VIPPSVDLSILYPVLVEPTLFDGAVHDRLICDVDEQVLPQQLGGCGIMV